MLDPDRRTPGRRLSDSLCEFTFKITHEIRRPKGYHVRFDITDAMVSVGRTPRETELRMISHTGPDIPLKLPPCARHSLNAAAQLPLQHSGAQYTISNAGFAIPPGSCHGLRITILTPEGVAGPPLTADLSR